MNFTNWDAGQPDNSGGREDCIHLNQPDASKWNDAPCNQRNIIVCQGTEEQTSEVHRESIQTFIYGGSHDVEEKLEDMKSELKALKEAHVGTNPKWAENMKAHLDQVTKELNTLAEANKRNSENSKQSANLELELNKVKKDLDEMTEEKKRNSENATAGYDMVAKFDKIKMELEDVLQENKILSESYKEKEISFQQGKSQMTIFFWTILITIFILVTATLVSWKIRSKREAFGVSFSPNVVVE